jgi:protein-S-isoprenylcysteine O-methyltransferase Ste14
VSLLQWALAALTVINAVVFAWGVWGVFVTRGQPTPALKAIKLGAVFTAAAQVAAIAMAREIHMALGYTGLAMLLASQALFWNCVRANRGRPLSLAYCPDVPDHLNRSGPYSWVRHPFYVSYLVTYFAGWVATTNHWLAIPTLMMSIIFAHAARREESKFLESSLAEQYKQYRADVGMFVPRPRTRRRLLSEP